MNSREALRDKRDGSIFVLVEIQSTDEPARLFSGLDLDLYGIAMLQIRQLRCHKARFFQMCYASFEEHE